LKNNKENGNNSSLHNHSTVLILKTQFYNNYNYFTYKYKSFTKSLNGSIPHFHNFRVSRSSFNFKKIKTETDLNIKGGKKYV